MVCQNDLYQTINDVLDKVRSINNVLDVQIADAFLQKGMILTKNKKYDDGVVSYDNGLFTLTGIRSS